MASTVTAKALADPAVWGTATTDGRDAYRALAWHVNYRFSQEKHPALEETDGAAGNVFLTTKYMQRCLKATGARCTGEKAARAAIRYLVSSGGLEDTGTVKKPSRSGQSVTRAQQFQTGGTVATEGGKDAQPFTHRSYWWRVFRVVRIHKVVAAANKVRGAYGTLQEVPQELASLSAFLGCQGLTRRRRKGFSPLPGSVQWQFLHYGPP